MNKVILFKAESDSSDAYANLLTENNFEAIFIPTLEFRFKNLDQLKVKLETPAKYAGLIFTSPRSVEACERALNGEPLDTKWMELNNYCVGEVTHNLIHTKFSLNARGKNTGNANNLADYIFEQLNCCESTEQGQGHEQFQVQQQQQQQLAKLPFLCPCGNLQQDTMEIKLLDFGYSIESIQTYETVAHSDLEENLYSLSKYINVKNNNGNNGDNINDTFKKTIYFAFFSPSGVTFILDIFKKLNLNMNHCKLIAIGPSTRRCLEQNDCVVYKTAAKPSVEYLIKALVDE